MKIIEPYVELESEINGEDILKTIEKVGRVCYKSEDRITEESAKRFVESLMKRGHESVIEHVSLSVRVVCDRGVTHEIVRHRVASYAQESTRYCNYGKDKFDNELTFINPCFWTGDEDKDYTKGNTDALCAILRYHLSCRGTDRGGGLPAADTVYRGLLTRCAPRHCGDAQRGYDKPAARPA